MGGKFHKNLGPSDGIHVPFSWIYATESERLAATGFVAGDIHKISYVTASKKAYILDDNSPISWSLITNVGTGGDHVLPGDGILVSHSGNNATVSAVPRLQQSVGVYLSSGEATSPAEVWLGDSSLNTLDSAGAWTRVARIGLNRYGAAVGTDPSQPGVDTGAVDSNTVLKRIQALEPSIIRVQFDSNNWAVFSILGCTVSGDVYTMEIAGIESSAGGMPEGTGQKADVTAIVNLNSVLSDRIVGKDHLIATDDTLEGTGQTSNLLGLADKERSKGIRTVWYSIKRTYAGFLAENSVDELSIDQEGPASNTTTDRDGNSFDKQNLKFVLIERRGESASDYAYLSHSTRIGDMFTIIRGTRWLTGKITHVVLGVGGGDGAMKIYYDTVDELSHGENNRVNAPYIGWVSDSGGTDLVVNFDSPGVTPEDIPSKENFVKDEKFIEAVKAAVTPEPEFVVINGKVNTGTNYATADDPVMLHLPASPVQLFIYLWLEDDDFDKNLEKITSYSKSGHVFTVINSNGTATFEGIWSSQTRTYMLADGSGQNSTRQDNSKMLRITVTVTSGSKSGSFTLGHSAELRLYPPFVTRDEVKTSIPDSVASSSLDVPTLYAVRQAIEKRIGEYSYIQIFDQQQSSANSDNSIVPISIPAASGNGDRSVTTGKVTVPLVAETSVLKDSDGNPIQIDPDKLFQVVGTGEIDIRVTVPTSLVLWAGVRYYHIGTYTPVIGNAVTINSPSTHWIRFEVHSGTRFIQIPLSELTTDVSLGAFNISQAILDGIKMTKVKYEIEFKFFDFNSGVSVVPSTGSKDNYGIADTTVTDTGLYDDGTITIKPFVLTRCRITHKQR